MDYIFDFVTLCTVCENKKLGGGEEMRHMTWYLLECAAREEEINQKKRSFHTDSMQYREF